MGSPNSSLKTLGGVFCLFFERWVIETCIRTLWISTSRHQFLRPEALHGNLLGLSGFSLRIITARVGELKTKQKTTSKDSFLDVVAGKDWTYRREQP